MDLHSFIRAESTLEGLTGNVGYSFSEASAQNITITSINPGNWGFQGLDAGESLTFFLESINPPHPSPGMYILETGGIDYPVP